MSNIRTIPVDTHSEFSAFVTGLGMLEPGDGLVVDHVKSNWRIAIAVVNTLLKRKHRIQPQYPGYIVRRII